MSGEFAGVWNPTDKTVVVCERDPQLVQKKYPGHLVIVQSDEKYDGFICVKDGVLNSTKAKVFISDSISDSDRKLLANWGGVCLTWDSVFPTITEDEPTEKPQIGQEPQIVQEPKVEAKTSNIPLDKKFRKW